METDGRQYQAVNRAALRECEARLEARDREIEELREALQYITSESGCEHLTTGLGSCYRSGKREDAEDWADKVCFPCKAHAALATPTPEGEPDDRVEAAYWDGRSDERKRWEPEQAHGDALAALDRIVDPEPPYGKNGNYHFGEDLKCVRRHLTASGAPYVPEEVRRLPEQWRRNPPRNAQDCAYDLESVLASAPADGWKMVPVEPTQAMIDAGDAAIECPEDWSASGYYGNDNAIAYRAMIAAAPQRGGGEIKRDERRWFGRDGSKWEGE